MVLDGGAFERGLGHKGEPSWMESVSLFKNKTESPPPRSFQHEITAFQEAGSPHIKSASAMVLESPASKTKKINVCCL